MCKPVIIGKETISCLMYADDLILLSETESGLQRCLDKLHSYIKIWKLKINIKKTKIVIFQKGGPTPNTIFYLGDQVIEKAKEYKYLGTNITYTGNFKQNEVNLKKKGFRASYLIAKNVGMHAKPSTSIKIFEKVVEPILLYNCEIAHAYLPKSWDYKKFNEKLWDIGEEVNKVILSFIRQILGVHKKSSTLMVLAETGKYPISLKIMTQILKYWIRLETSDDTLLIATKRSIEEQNKKGNQNWKKIVDYILRFLKIDQKPSTNAAVNGKLISTTKISIKNSMWNGGVPKCNHLIVPNTIFSMNTRRITILRNI